MRRTLLLCTYLLPILLFAADASSPQAALMSEPTPLVLDANVQSTVHRVGIFDHAQNVGATNFAGVPTQLGVPNSQTDADDRGDLFAQDMWGLGAQRMISCDALHAQSSHFVTLLTNSLTPIVSVFSEEDPAQSHANMQAMIDTQMIGLCDTLPNTLNAQKDILQGACEAFADCNGLACGALNSECRNILAAIPGEDLDTSCEGICPILSFDAAECVQSSELCAGLSVKQCFVKQSICHEHLDLGVQFPVEQITVADIRTGEGIVPDIEFNGESVAPYIGGLPDGVGNLRDATVIRRGGEDVGLVVLLGTSLDDAMASMGIEGNEGLAQLLQLDGYTPHMLEYRYETAGGQKRLRPHSISSGVLEAPLADGSLSACFPVDPNAAGVPPLSDADLLAKGCATESLPIRVLSLNLFGDAGAQDLVVINRGALADGHVGYATIYRDQGDNISSPLFAEQYRYDGFVRIGAEPYGAAVSEDLIEGKLVRSVLVASAVTTPGAQANQQQASVWKIVNDGNTAKSIEIPVATIVDDGDLEGFAPYEIIARDLNGDGLGDFVLTWIKNHDNDDPVRFAPFFHLYLGEGNHSYKLIARYDAPAIVEDGEALAESGGKSSSARAQLAGGAACDLDRDGILGLCMADSYARFIDGKRRAFVYYYRGLGGAVFDGVFVQQFQTNTREDFFPDPDLGFGGVRQVVVDDYQNVIASMGEPIIFDPVVAPQPEVVVPQPVPAGTVCADLDGDGHDDWVLSHNGTPVAELSPFVLLAIVQECTQDNCNPMLHGNLCGQGGLPSCANPNQLDTFGDPTIGDQCEPEFGQCGTGVVYKVADNQGAGDGDGDGWPDFVNPWVDTNDDGIGDSTSTEKVACDNCSQIANVDQANVDGDLFGDVCDLCYTIPAPNGFEQAEQKFPNAPSFNDFDQDGCGFNCDPDDNDAANQCEDPNVF